MKMIFFLAFYLTLSTGVLAEQTKKFTEIKISNIEKGQLKILSWNNTVLFIYHRTEEDISRLSKSSFEKNQTFYDEFISSRLISEGENNSSIFLEGTHINVMPYRSILPEWGVFSGKSPFSGCILTLVKTNEQNYFEDACTLEKFDLSGNNTAGYLLPIPFYKHDRKSILVANYPQSIRDDILFNPQKYSADELLERYIWSDKSEHALELLNRESSLAINSKKFPLHTAVANNNIILVKKLLELGADPLIEARSGKDAIQIAGELKYQEIKNLLLKHIQIR